MPDTTVFVPGLPTGWVVYTLLYDADAEVWDGSAFVAYDVADLADYATATPETPAASGTYACTFPPAAPAGFYTWSHRKRVAGTPAADDPEVGASAVPAYWDGAAFADPAAALDGESIAALDAILAQPKGTDKAYDFTLRDAAGAAITIYTGTEALSSRIWSGQDQATLASPVATWLVPAAGTVRVTVSDTNLADLPPSLYRMEGTLTVGSTVLRFFDGSIAVTTSPGVAEAPATYCSLADMLLYAPQVQKLQDARADLAGFLGGRARAKDWTDEHCLDGYRPNYGRARRGLAADGVAAGPHLHWVAAGPDGAATPTVADLRSALAAGGLVVTAKLREANAHMAAAIVFLNQPGKDNPYHQQGAYHADCAAALLAAAVIEIDLDDPPDGVADVRVGQDITWLG